MQVQMLYDKTVNIYIQKHQQCILPLFKVYQTGHARLFYSPNVTPSGLAPFGPFRKLDAAIVANVRCCAKIKRTAHSVAPNRKMNVVINVLYWQKICNAMSAMDHRGTSQQLLYLCYKDLPSLLQLREQFYDGVKSNSENAL